MAIPLFAPNPNIIKPYAFMDLDDTLFQTQRKIDTWQLPTAESETLVCAAVNKQDEPSSFMSQRQAIFFNWLLSSTEMIVVTARDRQEIKRVKLPFNSWQVLAHGAVILTSAGELLSMWQQHIHHVLVPLQQSLHQLTKSINSHNQKRNDFRDKLKLTAHTDTFIDSELTIFLTVKHAQKDHQALVSLAEQLPLLVPNFQQHFYVHINANNLAILPHSVHKRYAVQFLLEQHLDIQRPSFGFGDSLADLPFLQLLDWYGVPSHGQLHETFKVE